MRIANIDWSADSTIFMLSLFVLFVVVAALLERVSPSRVSKRRLSDRTTNRDLID